MLDTIPTIELSRIVNGLGALNNRFEGKTILITGGFGFLGRIFVQYFQYLNRVMSWACRPDSRCKMIVVDNLAVGSVLPDGVADDPNIVVLQHDITQPFFRKLDQKPIDFIINAAGVAAPNVYKRVPLDTMAVSYMGTINVLDLAYERGTQSIMNFSSSEVYQCPPDDQIPTNEKYVGAIPTASPRACYDYGKACIEVLNQIYYTKYKLNTKVVRPFNMYGFAHKSDTRVIPNFFKSILRNENLKVYGKNDNTRTFCFVVDGIDGFLRVLLLGRAGEIYNIGNDKPEITMWDLAHLIKRVTESDVQVEVVQYPAEYPDNEPKRRCPDITKACSELAYRPGTSLEDGLKSYWEWAKTHYA